MKNTPLSLKTLSLVLGLMGLSTCGWSMENELSDHKRFLQGKLIYEPSDPRDDSIVLPIAALLDPQESTFNLSKCGDVGQYVSISTGYRRTVKPENSHKWEVFIAPKYLIEEHKTSTAAHYESIVNASWTAPYAVILNYGNWQLDQFWYNTTILDNDTVVWQLSDILDPAIMRPTTTIPGSFTNFDDIGITYEGYFDRVTLKQDASILGFCIQF